jgi:hypothetical protein
VLSRQLVAEQSIGEEMQHELSVQDWGGDRWRVGGALAGDRIGQWSRVGRSRATG